MKQLESGSYFTMKFAPLLLGAVLILTAIYGAYEYFFADQTEADIWASAVFLLSGCGFLIVYQLFSKKFVRVILNETHIIVRKDRSELKVSWNNVESISQVQWFQPVLYKLQLKEISGYVLFISNGFYVSLNGYTWDKSALGKFIKNKKLQWNI